MLGITAVVLLIGELVHGQDQGTPAWLFTRSLQVGDAAFQVAIADSADERMRGLSGVPTMGSNEGLYFVYPTPRPLLFWMKDMRFSLDIVWIDERQRVVDIMEDVTPETFPTIFSSPRIAQYALEINAGRARETGIEIGDTVILY